VTQHGGSAVLFGQLYPTVWDMSAAAVLLICLTGHNLSTVLSLPAEPHRPDGDSGSGPKTALVGMLKPRRGRGRAHEYRAHRHRRRGRRPDRCFLGVRCV
jgi:hypothetical protein